MKPDYLVHELKYQEARTKGWPGWGGPERMAGEGIWLDRLFSYGGVPSSGRALELGCGEGHYSRLLAEKGYEVVGVDVSETAIQWAKEKTTDTRYEIEYYQLDLSKPGILASDSFDLIADGNCLHCIIGEDRENFLANIRRLLAPNGLFFISTLLSLNDTNTIIDLKGIPYRHVPSETNLRIELDEAGFVIRKFVAHPRWKGFGHADTRHATVHLTKDTSNQ
ncbi:MAG: class I SAM-dependent methyltransferase [Chloroflexota bacterium]